MPITNEKYRRMGLEMVRIVHECEAGMVQGTRYYFNAENRRADLQTQADAATGQEKQDLQVQADAAEAEALNMLKRAVRLPYRIEARIQPVITKFGAATVNIMLDRIGTDSLQDLQAIINPLKTYSDTLKTHYQVDGWTLTQIALDIQNTLTDIDTDEVVPIPIDYVDDF